MAIQSNNNNLNYLTDPTFTNFNRLFILLFQRTAGENNTAKDHRDSYFRLLCKTLKLKTSMS